MINSQKIYNLCNKYGWYTHGSTSEYDNMFTLAESNSTDIIAKDIADHSDSKWTYDIVLFILNR